ncbi:MAG: NusG domain II-containing protein [Magnetococcales bacterium]|nr:NusG domain II-containing protein [Magnetococcales bacterium]
MKILPLLAESTTPMDRLVMGISALGIVASAILTVSEPGRRVVVFRDNRPVLSLALDRDGKQEVAGRLGPVTIQVEQGRVRLLEYQSPRMIGTRTGWIQGAGRTAACVPCGIVLRVEGHPKKREGSLEFDAVSE